MKPAFAVSTRITSLPSAFSLFSAKPVAYRRGTQIPQIIGPLRLAPSNPSPNAPNRPITLNPPHPTDRVLSPTYCACAAHSIALIPIPCAHTIWVPRRFWLCGCLCLFSSSLLCHHHIKTLTLTLPLLYIISPITSPHLTLPRILEPHVLSPFFPLLLLSSCRFYFRPGIFATQI
jgi:hypothetical protein